MKTRRIVSIITKEYIHIFRDWRSLIIIILMPILMIILYGYAITFDIKNLTFAVIDDAKTPESRELIRGFTENRFFVLKYMDIKRGEIEPLFKKRFIQMVIVIPKDFSESLISNRVTKVQLLVDAADSNVGTFIYNYSNRVIQLYNEKINFKTPGIVNLKPRILYNPDMKSVNFFVPGLVALILLLISALLTSIAITREKETGTLEQILVSPVHPIEIIGGKVIPYITLGLLNGTIILLFARFLFKVPINGSLFLIAALALLYIFVALSFGLMISASVKTQLVAMLETLMSTVLPTIMLSGLIFPVASMPLPLRIISKAIPATHFLIIIRGIMLKGVGFWELWQHAAALSAIGFVLLFIATKRFKMTLE
ncbi:MAG: ABC transporter permease [Proteobacteria bacterium]|nr:ABC transporter permease [Pseudomonadota bacterium]MBU4037888.1 ABC transporter permease [Pseudomonadota bacterium]